MARALRFRFHRPGWEGRDALSVDGVAPAARNLSHWPGHRTPGELRHDLSTGAALALAALDPSRRAAWLSGLRYVTNDHYDTDGVLSVLAVLEPERALARSAELLVAARTGDFQVFTTERALALDLLLSSLRAAGSDPEAQERRFLRGLDLARRTLFEGHDPRLLLPEAERSEYRLVLEQLDGAEVSVRIERRPELRFVRLESDVDLHPVVRNTLAGDALRVLVVVPVAGGRLYRYVDRVEGWFDLVTVERPRRADLRAVAAELGGSEPPRGAARWRATPPDVPIPELWFGLEGEGRSFGPTRPGVLAPSRLPADRVERPLLETLGRADAAPRTG